MAASRCGFPRTCTAPYFTWSNWTPSVSHMKHSSLCAQSNRSLRKHHTISCALILCWQMYTAIQSIGRTFSLVRKTTGSSPRTQPYVCGHDRPSHPPATFLTPGTPLSTPTNRQLLPMIKIYHSTPLLPQGASCAARMSPPPPFHTLWSLIPFPYPLPFPCGRRKTPAVSNVHDHTVTMTLCANLRTNLP